MPISSKYLLLIRSPQYPCTPFYLSVPPNAFFHSGLASSPVHPSPLPLCTPQMHPPTYLTIPFNPPVTSSQHHSPCSSPLCTLLQSIVSQFLSPTNISLPIQSPSNIQSAPLTMQLPTMHSHTVNCFPIPLTHQYLPSHSIPQ